MKELKIYEINPDDLKTMQYAKIQTNKGNIFLKLFPEDAPQTVTNFATLARDGFYNHLTFHRVISNFVAQGGCPNGTGTGGPNYRIQCELKNNPNKHLRGSLSMAHAGRDTGGSQFFICFTNLPHLDGEHTVFGKIEDEDKESFEVLDSIQPQDTIETITILETKNV